MTTRHASGPLRVIRVTGLPPGTPHELQAFLSALIEDKIGVDCQETSFEISIIPSCYNWDAGKVGLVDFRGRFPSFLGDLISGERDVVQLQTALGDISFDNNFRGFTQLYPVEPSEQATADVIAICGVDGHPYGSWQGKNGLRRMWLRHFISKRYPTFRTMIYGYNAKLTSRVYSSLEDYTASFLDEIQRIRGTYDTQRRPLLLIGHSYGGLIIARALIETSRKILPGNGSEAVFSSFYRATYGAMFFAVPHRGMLVEDMREMLQQEQHPRETIMKEIDQESSDIVKRVQDFEAVIQNRQIVSFYETALTPSLQMGTNGKWNRTGKGRKSLKPKNSILGLPAHVETRIPLPGNHSTIVKFDSQNSEGYIASIARFDIFKEDGLKNASARFAKRDNVVQPSLINIPFSRNRKFIGREQLLTRLSYYLQVFLPLQTPQGRIGLWAMGGGGKTQIAIEFAYRAREFDADTWVFWVHANTPSRFRQSYKDIAAAIGLIYPEGKVPLRELSEWLLNKELGNWIMILDGLDDASVLCEPQVLDGEEHAPLRQFIPEVEHGSILVTSRSSEEANRIVLSQTDHDRKLEAVGPLEHEEALDLLRTLLPGVEESTESSELLNILQNNPLAIHQAGSYIRENGLQLSAYTRLLNLHDESVELLLSSTLRGAREDESATRTIMATWQLTFDQIRRNYPKSVEILYVFAMFCEVPLPFEYLNYSDESPWDFVRKGFPIINHSIVRVEPSSWSSSYLWHAHPLVYFAIRRWMETQQADSLEIWQSRALKLIADKFPAVNHRLQWTECEKLIPHALKILGYSLTGRDNELNRASILYKLSCYDIDQNKHFLGLERAQEALRITRKHLGNDHEQTVVNVGQTARINMMLHRFKDAEGLFQEAIEIQKRINGPEDRQTIANMASLAMVWSRLGPTAWPQAEELMSTLLQAKAVEYVDAELEEEDVESQKTVLSEYDPLRLGIMTIQADIYSYRHEWLEAEKLESRVLQMRLWAGNEYPDIFWSMRNLSFTYLQMGLYEEAEAIKRHLVDYAMRELGPKHPETLQEMAMLARTLQLQGRGLEGDRLIINALEWHQDISGADHPGTIVMMGFKAKQHILAKEWFEAEKLLSEVIEMETRIYGPKNPSTLCSKGDLLVVYSSTDRSKQAVPMAEQLWKDFQETLGETHPQTVTALENYAYVCLTRGGWTIWKKGYDLATRANDLQRERLGPDHPKVVVAQKTLKVLENLGKGRPPFGKSHRVGKRLSKQAILGSIFPWRALRTFLDSAGRPQ